MPSLVENGPVVLERKIFKSCHLFLLFPNYLPFRNGVGLHLNKLESPSPRDTLCHVWLKLALWFWRRRFLKVGFLLLFSNYLPFGKDMALHLNKLESPLSRDALCQVWLKMAQCFYRGRFLKVFIYSYFPIISDLGRAWPFI